MNVVWKLCGISFLSYQTFRNLHFYYVYRQNKVKVIDILYDVYDLLPKMYPMNFFSKDEWNYWERNLSIKNLNYGMSDFYNLQIQKDMKSIMIYRRKCKMYIDQIDTYDPKGFKIIDEDDLKRMLDLMFHLSIFHWEHFYKMKKNDFDKELHIKYHMKKLDRYVKEIEDYIHLYFQEKPILYIDCLGIYNTIIYIPFIFYFTNKWISS